MGLTIGEYIRNRRVSLAAQDLLKPDSKIIDVAMRYQYDTQESFSKAFTRFHGISPSKLQKGQNKLFHPLTINVTIQGGFDMSWKLTNEFHLVDWKEIEGKQGEKMTPAEKYQWIVGWAGKARGKNPGVFDALTEWILDDSEWTDDKLEENEQILIQGVFARFKEQNARIRKYLKELEPSGVVNTPVFKALDIFDDELSGHLFSGSRPDDKLQDLAAKIFVDFSIMGEHSVREQIAGNKTGIHGTDSVDIFGFINYLKGSDAQVQWCLFMPDKVEDMQKGFKVESFENRKMPAMRFIGRECEHVEDTMTRLNLSDIEARREGAKESKELFHILDTMSEYKADFEYDVLFMHHYGLNVDIGPWHGFWGRFFKADTPVPEGFVHFDFIPDNDGKQGPPYCAQFAFAIFSSEPEALHKREGYDSDAMYDTTRNIILGQGVQIPYPYKYWTAEVFLDGCENESTAYMFSTLE
jgi:hypothetical protein